MVFTGILDQMIVTGGGASVLRLLRVLRPLRTSNRIKSIKTITSTIFKSLVPMQHVLLLMLFFSVLASIIALHLFGASGAVGALCRSSPFPLELAPNGDLETLVASQPTRVKDCSATLPVPSYPTSPFT